jgi:endoglucanase
VPASPQEPAADHDEELVVNGGFDDSTTAPWKSHAAAATRVVEGMLRIEVTGHTTDFWDSMIGQNDIRLDSGKTYALSFDAYATASTTVRATVQLGGPPYGPYTVDREFPLSTSTQRFTHTGTGTMTTTAGEVTFQIGGSAKGSAVFLDNVSLVVRGGPAAGGSQPADRQVDAAESGGGSAGPQPIATHGPTSGRGPFSMTTGLYVDPGSNPALWVAANRGDARATAIFDAIASKPISKPFGGWSGDIGDAVSAYVSAGAALAKLPVLQVYNIPGRDCGGASGGGAASPEAYRNWIAELASAIGDRPAVVILEPDALAQVDCVNASERMSLLRYATEQLRDKAPNTWAYLDAGTSRWIDSATMARRLIDAGVHNVRGFSVNVANYFPTAESVGYANAVVAALGGTAGFIVDTSRNGAGGDGAWCNPPGRRLGAAPQIGVGEADALLWIKVPGESDGPCGIGGGIPAGQFSADLAVALIGGH